MDIDKIYGSPKLYGFGDEFDSWADVFTQSECYVLAKCFYDLSGGEWRMVQICNQTEEYVLSRDIDSDVGWWLTGHLVVQHPSGFWLDINGLQPPGDIIDQWADFIGDTPHHFPISEETYELIWRDQEPMDYDVTLHIARHMYDELQEISV